MNSAQPVFQTGLLHCVQLMGFLSLLRPAIWNRGVMLSLER